MHMNLILALVIGGNIVPLIFIISRKVLKDSVMLSLCVYLLILTGIVFNLGLITNMVDPIHFLWMGPLTSTAFIAFLFMLYRRVVKPIKGIKEKLDAAANCDLTMEMHGKFKHEFKSISESYNNFISAVGEILNNIKMENKASVEMNRELTSSFNNTTLSIERIQENIAKITEQINLLNEEIKTSSDLSMEIQENTLYSMESIQNQNEEISESSAAIEEIGASIHNVEESISSKIDLIDQLVSITMDGERKVTENNEIIQKVVSSTNSIGGFIKVINDVASQTNLLAMNAAIEAAHAGQYGRGFAVVANEIRKLAEDSSNSATQISNSLSTVVSNIDNSVKSSLSINKIFKDILNGVKDVSGSMAEIKHAMSELSISSNQIIQSLTNLTENAQNLKESGTDIQHRSKTIADSMIHIHDISEEAKIGIHTINTGIGEIMASAQLMNTVGHKRDQHIDQLNGLINKFQTKDEFLDEV